jgi:hypothetical protein|tara:strand:+ start:430 stop:732 length:303 start_codon:yes stop_codon:yes gene_type:complete
MADEPDIETLARRFLDLWQEQVAANVSDPRFAGLFAGARPKDRAENHADDSASISAPSGAAAAGLSPGLGDDQLDEFARRLADCTERLGALERRTKGQRD